MFIVLCNTLVYFIEVVTAAALAPRAFLKGGSPQLVTLSHEQGREEGQVHCLGQGRGSEGASSAGYLHSEQP